MRAGALVLVAAWVMMMLLCAALLMVGPGAGRAAPRVDMCGTPVELDSTPRPTPAPPVSAP